MRRTNDPFERMEAMFDQMRRSATSPRVGGGRSTSPIGVQSRTAPGAGRTHDAGVTLEERDDEYVVLADLPGFERDEIELTLDDGVLSIDGTHEVTDDQESRQRTVSEWVRLPGGVERDDVSATYRNGVLEVRLPVAAGSGDEHRIDVE